MTGICCDNILSYNSRDLLLGWSPREAAFPPPPPRMSVGTSSSHLLSRSAFRHGEKAPKEGNSEAPVSLSQQHGAQYTGQL